MLPPDADLDFAGSSCLQGKAPVDLWPKETIAWTGRPVPSLLVMREVVPSLLMALGGFGCLVAWAKDVAGTGDAGGVEPGRHLLWGALWVLALVALGSAIAGPFLAWIRARRTAYLLTNRRALIARVGRRSVDVVREYGLEDLVLCVRVDREGGAGDLVFERRRVAANKMEPLGFLGVEDVQGVERLLRGLIAAVPEASPGSPKGLALRLSRKGKRVPDVGGAEPVSSYPLANGVRIGQAAMMAVLGTLAVVGVVRTPFDGPVALGMTALGAAGFASICRNPIELALCDDHTLSVRRWFPAGREFIPIRSIRSIRGRGGPRSAAEPFLLTHDRGRVWCSGRIRDVRGLLATLKFLNPAIEVDAL